MIADYESLSRSNSYYIYQDNCGIELTIDSFQSLEALDSQRVAFDRFHSIEDGEDHLGCVFRFYLNRKLLGLGMLDLVPSSD